MYEALNTEYGIATAMFVSIMSDILVIYAVQSIIVLKTFEKVSPFERVQTKLKSSYTNLAGSNFTLKTVPPPLKYEWTTIGVDDPYFKMEHV